jgi:hypothetical protein
MSGIAITLTGAWAEASRAAQQLAAGFKKAADRAVLAEANFLRGHIVKNLTSGGAHAGAPFAALSPNTLIIRKFKGFGGSKPLMVTGALRNSISVVRLPGGACFVGVRRGAPHAGAPGGAANLAAIHEEGRTFTIQMTAKMRKFLAVAFSKAGGPKRGAGGGGGAVIVIRIPARPFVGPALDRYARRDDVKARFWERVNKDLGGILGPV